MSTSIDDLLKIACERKASDLHLKVGNYPYVRVDGELVPLIETKRLTAEDTLGIALGHDDKPAEAEIQGKCRTGHGLWSGWPGPVSLQLLSTTRQHCHCAPRYPHSYLHD